MRIADTSASRGEKRLTNHVLIIRLCYVLCYVYLIYELSSVILIIDAVWRKDTCACKLRHDCLRVLLVECCLNQRWLGPIVIRPSGRKYNVIRIEVYVFTGKGISDCRSAPVSWSLIFSVLCVQFKYVNLYGNELHLRNGCLQIYRWVRSSRNTKMIKW